MIKLILIDDHKLILDGVSSLLANDETISIYKTFQNPVVALEFLENNTVDIVFTDLNMPEMNGEDVVVYIKSKFPSTKVIVLSMHNEKSVIQHLIEVGADGYLLKSAGSEEIIRAINLVSQGAKYFAEDVLQSLITKKSKVVNDNPLLNELTNRELEIIKLIAEGLSSKHIADKLYISPRTVETHRNNILKKLDIHGVAGIIRFAFQNNLVQ